MNPMLLLIEVLLGLALWALYGAWLLGLGSSQRALWFRGWPRRWLERERAHAAALGWSPRAWYTFRVAGLTGCLGAGIWAGTPLTAGSGLVLGVAGLPYLLSAQAEKRRLLIDQAMVEVVRTLVALVRTSNQTLDQALTDQGLNPGPLLRPALTPLGDSNRSIRDRLIEVDRRLASSVANRICLDLLIALHVSPEAFLDAAERILLPQYDQDLQIRRRDHATAAGARQSALITISLMVVMFLLVMATPALRGPYETLPGQLVLLLVMALVGGILWLIRVLTPRPARVRWDLAEMDRLLERRYG